MAKAKVGITALPAFDSPSTPVSIPLFSETGWNSTWNQTSKSFTLSDRNITNGSGQTSLLGDLNRWLAQHASIPTTYFAQTDRDGASIGVTLKEAYRQTVVGSSTEPLYIIRYTVNASKNGQQEQLQGLIALSVANAPPVTPSCQNLTGTAPDTLGPIPANTSTNIPVTYANALHIKVTQNLGGNTIYTATVTESATPQNVNVPTPVLSADADFTVAVDNGACLITRTTHVQVQGATCPNISASPGSQSFPHTGGSGAISITAGNGCATSATTTDAWISIAAPASGTGNRTLNYTVTSNTGFVQRAGTIVITGQGGPITVTITQGAPPPQFNCSTAPLIASFSATPASAAPGSSITLSWNASGSDSLLINQGVGNVTGQTSIVITAPAATTTYTLSATNLCGPSGLTTTFTPAEPSGTCPQFFNYQIASGIETASFNDRFDTHTPKGSYDTQNHVFTDTFNRSTGLHTGSLKYDRSWDRCPDSTGPMGQQYCDCELGFENLVSIKLYGMGGNLLYTGDKDPFSIADLTWSFTSPETIANVEITTRGETTFKINDGVGGCYDNTSGPQNTSTYCR